MNNLTEPFNPRLSELPEAGMQATIKLILKECASKSSQIQSYKDRGVQDMFADEIIKLRNEIADLVEIFVQFTGALKAKQAERISQSN